MQSDVKHTEPTTKACTHTHTCSPGKILKQNSHMITSSCVVRQVSVFGILFFSFWNNFFEFYNAMTCSVACRSKFFQNHVQCRSFVFFVCMLLMVAYICLHIYVYVCIFTHMYTHTSTHTCIHIFIHTYMYVYVKYVYRYTCVYIYTYIYIYIYVYIYTYIYTYIYIDR